MTDRSAQKGNTAISCTYFVTQAMNSGRPIGIYTCHQTVVVRGRTEQDATRSDVEKDPGDNEMVAEAPRGRKDLLIAGEGVKGAGAAVGAGRGVETAECPITRERTTGRPGPGQLAAGKITIGAGVESEAGQGAEVQIETRTGQGIRTGSEISIEAEVEIDRVKRSLVKWRERGTGPGAKVHTERDGSRVEKVVLLRSQIGRTKPLMTRTQSVVVNTPKRARRKARKSTRRRKAVHPESLLHRTSQRKSKEKGTILQQVPVKR